MFYNTGPYYHVKPDKGQEYNIMKVAMFVINVKSRITIKWS